MVTETTHLTIYDIDKQGSCTSEESVFTTRKLRQNLIGNRFKQPPRCQHNIIFDNK